MSLKKILIDATGIVSVPTGLGKYSFYVLKSLLSNKKFRFTVLHQSDISDTRPFLSLRYENADFIPVKVPVIGPKRELVMFALKDVINQHSIFHCLSSYLPAFGINIPSLLTIHDLKYLLFPQFFKNRIKALYYSWIIRRGIRRATQIIAISHATKRDLLNLDVTADKISVIYEAPTITTDKQSTVLPDFLESKRFLLFVGENRPHKNVDRIVKAHSIVAEELREMSPYIVFAGHRFEALKRNYVNDFFIFLGPVSEGMLVSLYMRSLALIYPSLYEGFGLPLVEAMALGTPVITSNFSSMQEVTGGAALLIDPYDVEQLASAIVKITTDENERNRLKALGLRRAEQFSWEQTANSVFELYERI